TVNTANDTINIGTGTTLRTGDIVTYDREGHTLIGGLIQGQQYFARVVGGLLSLYDSEAHALAGGVTRRTDLTSVGALAQQFTFNKALQFNPTLAAVRFYGNSTDAGNGTATGLVDLTSIGGQVGFTAGAGNVSLANDTINIGAGTAIQTGDQVIYDA